MALAYLLDPTKQYQNRAGVNNVDGWLEVFLAGTDDHADVYVNFDRSRAEERIGIDNNGRAVMIVEAGVAYRVEMHEPNGELVFTQEPIFPIQADESQTYDVVSSDNSIVVEKTVVGNDTTFDLSVAEDDVNRLDWIRCEGSRLLACSDIYLPVYADGPMEVGSVGVRLGAGKYYHVTAHVRATKAAVSPWYDRVFVELSQKFPTGPDTVITNQSFVVDGSMELVQDFEVSCDTMVESDCELKIEIVGDLNNVTYAVTDLEIHRVYSGVAQGGGGSGPVEQVQSDWAQTDTEDPSYIRHKPVLATVATTGDYNDLYNKPSIPADKVYIFWDMGFNRSEIRSAIEEHKVIMDWDRTSNEHRFFTRYEEKVIDGNLCELYHFAHVETDYVTPFATTWRLGDMCYIYDTVRQIQYAEHDTKLFDHEVPSPTSADAGKVLTAAWNPDQAAGSWSWQTQSAPTIDQTYNASSTNAQSGTAVAEAVSGKADKVSGATNGNFAGLDSNGNLTDSGSKASDFATSSQGSKADSAIQSVKVNGSALTPDANKAVDITVPAAQVNSDWNASSGVAEILNKPTLATVATSGSYNDLSNKPSIPAAQVQSDWNQSDSGAVDYIKNKPSLATVATSGSYNDLTNKPTIPAAQVQSDWSQSNSGAVDYIKNKPTMTGLVAGSNITLSESGGTLTISSTGGSVTVDQTYNSSSTNAQSGTAVAGAIATVRQVPTTQSSDNGKVLGVTDANGTLGWVAQSGGTSYSAGNMISLTNNEVAVSTTAGITDIQQVAALPANPVSTVLYLIPAT